jgi:hypothetical protein
MQRSAVCLGLAITAAAVLAGGAVRADEFMAMPGLWKTSYTLRGGTTEIDGPKVVWRCVDEDADPWASFAQLKDLPGLSCSRPSLQRTSTSLKWRTECHAAGPADSADTVATEGAVVFDSIQHYKGWVKFTGTLMGYPIRSVVDMEGSRHAACTSPTD